MIFFVVVFFNHIIEHDLLKQKRQIFVKINVYHYNYHSIFVKFYNYRSTKLKWEDNMNPEEEEHNGLALESPVILCAPNIRSLVVWV